MYSNTVMLLNLVGGGGGAGGAGLYNSDEELTLVAAADDPGVAADRQNAIDTNSTDIYVVGLNFTNGHLLGNGSGDPYADGNGIYTRALIDNPAVQVMFYLVYTTIFVLGLFGNVLVCYVVLRNNAMQSVTNFFITNLALSDILLCVLAVPFTPLYSFLDEWVFGDVLCHMVPYSTGVSVYISTLTLTSIAVDRFFVIIYPFKERMKLRTSLIIIVTIWIFSVAVTLPYGINMQLQNNEDKYYCEEDWPEERSRLLFSAFTAGLQFVIPFFLMTICYVCVSHRLSNRVRAKPGAKSSRKDEQDRERKRRTNRMLIAMVAIFGGSWLPLTLTNFVFDLSTTIAALPYSQFCFFVAHTIAMSSTCYNPFLYAWLNENFKREFKQVLPCFAVEGAVGGASGGGGCGGSIRGGGRHKGRHSTYRSCNGDNNTAVTNYTLTTAVYNTSNETVCLPLTSAVTPTAATVAPTATTRLST